jgi:hypothetical protein
MEDRDRGTGIMIHLLQLVDNIHIYLRELDHLLLRLLCDLELRLDIPTLRLMRAEHQPMEVKLRYIVTVMTDFQHRLQVETEDIRVRQIMNHPYHYRKCNLFDHLWRIILPLRVINIHIRTHRPITLRPFSSSIHNIPNRTGLPLMRIYIEVRNLGKRKRRNSGE